ncbi:unnamed protein product [Cylicocyclus nassatus]|uniref:Uncharacterized protein n=1 Tax=Cylicocyclus nassatus TaxID=53992 RepID=A0AA36GLG7_CYLNA|nr:unnamed protein product [Cylicocyclus nassatus]
MKRPMIFARSLWPKQHREENTRKEARRIPDIFRAFFVVGGLQRWPSVQPSDCAEKATTWNTYTTDLGSKYIAQEEEIAEDISDASENILMDVVDFYKPHFDVLMDVDPSTVALTTAQPGTEEIQLTPQF